MKVRLLVLVGLWMGLSASSNAGNIQIELPAGLIAETATLIVKGKIKRANPAYLDLKTLMQFKATSFDVANRWTGEMDRCTGAVFSDVLDFLEMDSDAVLVDIIAANDYKVTIRVADIRKYDYLLAYKLNGKFYRELPPRQNKGPVAIAINFNRFPELDWDVYKHHLVWFVKTIIVR